MKSNKKQKQKNKKANKDVQSEILTWVPITNGNGNNTIGVKITTRMFLILEISAKTAILDELGSFTMCISIISVMFVFYLSNKICLPTYHKWLIRKGR